MNEKAAFYARMLESLAEELVEQRGRKNAYWDNENLLNAYYWAARAIENGKFGPGGRNHDEQRCSILRKEIVFRMDNK